MQRVLCGLPRFLRHGASKGALLVAGLAVVGQHSALAQESGQDDEAAESQIEELVVTGSYIRRSAQDGCATFLVRQR